MLITIRRMFDVDVRSCLRLVLAPPARMTASLNHTSLSEMTDGAALRRSVRSSGQGRQGLSLRVWW